MVKFNAVYWLIGLLACINTAQANPSLPGGDTSQSHRSDRNSYNLAAGNLDLDRRLNFEIGRAIFEKLWVFSPSSTTASDGLGPLYNARSCAACHQRNGRGKPHDSNQPDSSNWQAADKSLLIKLAYQPQQLTPAQQSMLDKTGSLPDPLYGRQIQPAAWPGADAEAQVQVRYHYKTLEFADGESIELRQPEYRLIGLKAPLNHQTQLSARLAPPMVGLGLLEAIAEQDIRTLADPDDKDGDGISGRTNSVWNPARQQPGLGRFNWKAASASLDQQNMNALNNDIGISNWLHPDGWGDCTAQQPLCRQQPHGNTASQDDFEAARQITDVLLFFSRHLAVPKRPPLSPDAQAGQELFQQAGCQRCHQPEFKTAAFEDRPELSEQSIWPYTDLLLHDMGADLADPVAEFSARGSEWRTPPLWGIGLNSAVNGNSFYLHDGRARTLMEAILWHGGEGNQARQQVLNMDKHQRQQLIQFLESL